MLSNIQILSNVATNTLSTPPRITRSMNHLRTPTSQPRRVTPIPTAPRKPNVRFSMKDIEERERPGTPCPPEIEIQKLSTNLTNPEIPMAENLTNPETIDFLSDENHQGFKVHYNREERTLSIFDLGEGISGKSRKHVRDTWTQLQKDYPRMAGKIGFSKFKGLRKKTPSCDVTTAIELCQLYPGKAAAEFRRSCAVTIRRVLAGDSTLIDEIVENSLRTDNVSQLMQEANDAALSGPSRLRQRRNAVTPQDPHRSDIWYASRELRSKPRHNSRSQMMKEKFPELKQKDFREWNTKICETVTGMTPKDFSKETGAKAHNRRDYYNSWGLATQSWLDSTAIEFMENENTRTFEDLKEGFGEISELMKKLREKKGLFKALPEKPTRQILSAREALAIENNNGGKRQTDNIYQ